VARPRSITVAGAAQELASGLRFQDRAGGIYSLEIPQSSNFNPESAALVSRLSQAEDFGAGTWNQLSAAGATRQRFDSNLTMYSHRNIVPQLDGAGERRGVVTHLTPKF
jgi:hypothetical protein